MIKYFMMMIMLCNIAFVYGQNNFTAKILDAENKLPLLGASTQVVGTTKGSIANEFGIIHISNIPNGRQQIKFSCVGKETVVQQFTFPMASSDTILIELKENSKNDLGEVIVYSTRSSRTIKNNPTRIETIDAEELEEKSNMKAANVSMVLHESTGIQVQQTNATSGNVSIRVQGLDGRYTQLLKDGYPNFGNFASGLSLLEIPPLDLKQVEIIKGPASTLYGGGAIAGVVNFISKTPKEKAEYSGIINQSNIGQTSIGAFAAQRNKKLGYTILGLYNKQKAYDVDKDDFSEVPISNNFTINPRVFIYPNKSTSLLIGNNFSQGEMIGGDMLAIQHKADSTHTYFEKNNTIRNTTNIEFEKKFSAKSNFKLEQSVSFFDRKISIPNYQFSGFNTQSFTHASYVVKRGKHVFISGINLVYDNFKDRHQGILDAKSFTKGAYTQHTFDINERIKLESGLRIDRVRYSNNGFSKNQTFVLPRMSALFKLSNKLNTRIGGGLGYKIPTIFTEQTETNQYQNILPLQNVTAERSFGGTFDIHYKTALGEYLSISINQMFFHTQINKPLVLKDTGSFFSFRNANKPVTTSGFETNLKLVFKDNLKLLAGYTYTNTKAAYLTGNTFLPLLPKDKLNLCLIYEKEDNCKLGLEGYITNKQYLSNGTQTPLYWEFGFMAEKTIYEHYIFFINFENFTDTRQSRYKRVVNEPHNSPTFDEIWTHTEGFVFNGGFKVKF